MEQLTRLEEFRQALYEKVLTRRRDAQFELLDALLLAPPIRSFPELTLSRVFRRRWSSAYKALEQGRQDEGALLALLAAELPAEAISLFALDESPWPRPEAPTVEDRGFVHGAPAGVDHRGTVIGHSYSTLAYVAEADSSWALPLSCRRVASGSDAITVALAQIHQLERHIPDRFSLYVGDSRYGNHRFLGGFKSAGTCREVSCAVLVRLRGNRVLYRDPGPYRGNGRPALHGEPFRFKDCSSWGRPDQSLRFEDRRYGQVELRLWHGLHAKEDASVRFSVLGAWVRLEQARPGGERLRPTVLWLAWLCTGAHAHHQRSMPLLWVWRFYGRRSSLEASFRYRKQHLYWTRPMLHQLATAQRWTTLLSLAQWQLWLSRELVSQRCLPWQRKQQRLTPARVRQSLGGLFAELGTPAAAPKQRGTSPGWVCGRARLPRIRHPVVNKGTLKGHKRRKAA